MARFKIDDVEKYGNSTRSSFFGLKDDGDVARVRFMYNDISDVECFAVHEIGIDGKKRCVNCLRSYDDPIDKCPFCKSGKFQRIKLYIPLYDVETGEVKVWERGKKFINKINSICSRYNPVCSHIFEIERHGKKGDQTTTYEIYEISKDDTQLSDLPEVPNILGSIVMDKSADEMSAYLEAGEFSSDNNSRPSQSEPIRRRTPATARNTDEVF